MENGVVRGDDSINKRGWAQMWKDKPMWEASGGRADEREEVNRQTEDHEKNKYNQPQSLKCSKGSDINVMYLLWSIIFIYT